MGSEIGKGLCIGVNEMVNNILLVIIIILLALMFYGIADIAKDVEKIKDKIK